MKYTLTRNQNTLSFSYSGNGYANWKIDLPYTEKLYTQMEVFFYITGEDKLTTFAMRELILKFISTLEIERL